MINRRVQDNPGSETTLLSCFPIGFIHLVERDALANCLDRGLVPRRNEGDRLVGSDDGILESPEVD